MRGPDLQPCAQPRCVQPGLHAAVISSMVCSVRCVWKGRDPPTQQLASARAAPAQSVRAPCLPISEQCLLERTPPPPTCASDSAAQALLAGHRRWGASSITAHAKTAPPTRVPRSPGGRAAGAGAAAAGEGGVPPALQCALMWCHAQKRGQYSPSPRWLTRWPCQPLD